ncbi:zinc finger CCCH-type antiviral 1-like [Pelobates cultripes]|uniref:Zinc finger CCCH-type antiviral 1-like n=1 Tax=Pelobates cultripes TaxID=61616 RepID=A0AAD1RS62_PELCU|nr:zinc finger CCCH-type antiviral 1-like [Pelobates cultripes]
MPGACVKYLYDKCDQDKCYRLHMCGYFMRGECNRRTCKRSHNLLEKSTNFLIKNVGIPAVSVENFQKLAVLKNIQILQTQGKRRGRGRGASRGRRGGRGRKNVHKGPHSQTRSKGRSVGSNEQRQCSTPGTDSSDEIEDSMLLHGSTGNLEPSRSNFDESLEIYLSKRKESAASFGSASFAPKVKSGPFQSCTITNIPTKASSNAQQTTNLFQVKTPMNAHSASSAFANRTTLVQPPNATKVSSGGLSSAQQTTTLQVNESTKVSTRDLSSAQQTTTVQVNESTKVSTRDLSSAQQTTSVQVNESTKVSTRGLSSAQQTTTVQANESTKVLTRGLSSAQQTTTVQVNESTKVSTKDLSSAQQTTTVQVNESTKVSTRGLSSAQQTPAVQANESTKVLTRGLSSAQQTTTVQVNESTKVSTKDLYSAQQTTTVQVNESTKVSTRGLSSAQQTTAVQANESTKVLTRDFSSAQQATKVPITVSSNALQTTPVKYNISTTLPVAGSSRDQESTVVRNDVRAYWESHSQEVTVASIHPLVSPTKPSVTQKITPTLTREPSVAKKQYCVIDDFKLLNISPNHGGTAHNSVGAPSLTKTAAVNQNVDINKNQEPKKVTDFTEICLFNVWKFCKFGSRCEGMHYHLPYRWQISLDRKWEDLTDMETIEREYCDPKKDRYSSLDFLTMKSGSRPIRRLCTPSSVSKPDEFVLTTEWLWYWKDELGTWIQYGKSNAKQVSATMTSGDLENIYLSDSNATIPFLAGQQQYEIDFKLMTQRNMVYRTQREVCRRPKFLSIDDVTKLKGSTKSSSSNTTQTHPLKSANYPEHWDKASMPEYGHKVNVKECIITCLTGGKSQQTQNGKI